MDINATFWHIAKIYFTCIKPLLWLVALSNMNKINPFFSNKYHIMKNIVIITQMWHGAKCYFTCTSTIWYLITVPNMNKFIPPFSEISQ